MFIICSSRYIYLSECPRSDPFDLRPSYHGPIRQGAVYSCLGHRWHGCLHIVRAGSGKSWVLRQFLHVTLFHPFQCCWGFVRPVQLECDEIALHTSHCVFISIRVCIVFHVCNQTKSVPTHGACKTDLQKQKKEKRRKERPLHPSGKKKDSLPIIVLRSGCTTIFRGCPGPKGMESGPRTELVPALESS